MSKMLNKLKKFLSFVPDKPYLQLYYFSKFHRFINFKNPRSFNEKLQWLKLYDRKPEYTEMVDKYEAKNYVSNLVGEQYVIPTYGVWDSFDEINFDTLPDQFVLKCTHDSGGLIICRDKSKLDFLATKQQIEECLKTDYYCIGREWPYKNVKPRIIAEKYMEEASRQGVGLVDYKFYCINGIPQFLYVSQGMENQATARVSFLTMEWRFAPFGRSDYAHLDELPHKPQKFNEMKVLAEKLSKGHSFLRVDFYEINNQIYFGELTFYPCGGMIVFNPPEWDRKIGEMIRLP